MTRFDRALLIWLPAAIVFWVALIFLFVAHADACEKVSAEEANVAARCLLRVDGRNIVDGTCRMRVAPDGHSFSMERGVDRAEVGLDPTQLTRDGRYKATLRWNGASLGEVRFDERAADDRTGMCFRNARASMCLDGFMLCEEEKR